MTAVSSSGGVAGDDEREIGEIRAQDRFDAPPPTITRPFHGETDREGEGWLGTGIHPVTTREESILAPPESIIAGARGIVYFDHNFGPETPGSTILGEGYADNRAMAKSVNAQIKSLAPVLNSPTVRSGWSQGAGRTAMVKWAAAKKAKANKRCMSKKAKGNLYVFAGSAGSPVEGRFSLPCVGGAKAEVVGENRTIPIRRGSFTDQFAGGNAIHIYRIDGGSTCGLPR